MNYAGKTIGARDTSVQGACGGKPGLFASGICLKRDGWIVSVYRGMGDPYGTIKVRKAENLAEDRARCR